MAFIFFLIQMLVWYCDRHAGQNESLYLIFGKRRLHKMQILNDFLHDLQSRHFPLNMCVHLEHLCGDSFGLVAKRMD